MRTVYKALLLSSMLALSTPVITGCSAITTSITKGDLSLDTQLSDTIWLQPSSNNTVFVQIRNTSDKPMPNISNKIRESLAQYGMVVTNNPEEAQYWLQANIVSIRKSSTNDSESYLAKGAESFLIGTAAGLGFYMGKQDSYTDYWGYSHDYGHDYAGEALLVGVAVGVASYIANIMVDDVYYTAVTDLLISEKVPNGVISQTESKVTSGNNTRTESITDNVTDKMQHTTRIVSVANKVNLKYEECANEIENALVHAISNIFAQ